MWADSEDIDEDQDADDYTSTTAEILAVPPSATSAVPATAISVVPASATSAVPAYATSAVPASATSAVAPSASSAVPPSVNVIDERLKIKEERITFLTNAVAQQRQELTNKVTSKRNAVKIVTQRLADWKNELYQLKLLPFNYGNYYNLYSKVSETFNKFFKAVVVTEEHRLLEQTKEAQEKEFILTTPEADLTKFRDFIHHADVQLVSIVILRCFYMKT